MNRWSFAKDDLRYTGIGLSPIETKLALETHLSEITDDIGEEKVNLIKSRVSNREN